jgi:hypothetical protein
VLVNGIYLNTITSMGELNPDSLDVTDISKEKRYIHRAIHPLTITAVPTMHFAEQCDFLNLKQGAEIRVEVPKFGMYVFHGQPSVGLPSAEVGKVVTTDIDIHVEDIVGWQDLIIPNGVCPNCGGQIIDAYGCCPWCGGWVEWLRR